MQAGWIDSPHHELLLGDFALESGEVIRDFRLSYALHGATGPLEPGALRNAGNVVLALSAIGSTHHRLDFLIGSGMALDPRELIVIAVDAIGNGLTTSPSTSALQPGNAFPSFNIRDMVASQLALIDHLGVGRLKCVIGASMGGMQALQWAVSHGDRIERLVAMTPMARTTPWAAVINETSRRALLADPDALERDAIDPDAAVPAARPNAGWAAWVPLMHLISGRTPAQIDREFTSPADVIDWVGRRTRWWTGQAFNAIDWIYQSRAYDAHDVGLTPGFAGDTDRALGSVTVPALILAPPLDLYNPAHEARAVAERMPAARFVEISSDWGHQSASPADPVAADLLNRLIRRFLDGDLGAEP